MDLAIFFLNRFLAKRLTLLTDVYNVFFRVYQELKKSRWNRPKNAQKPIFIIAEIETAQKIENHIKYFILIFLLTSLLDSDRNSKISTLPKIAQF